MGIWGPFSQTARRLRERRSPRIATRPVEVTRQRRSLQLERFEERMLLAISPQLIAVIPNQGELLENGDTRDTALRELTFRFDEGQIIDPATVAAIRIHRGGPDGQLGTGDDVLVQPGFLGIGERPNEVVFRFAEQTPDDLYQITIVGSGVAPLANTSGDVFNDGVDLVSEFELDLGPQVRAVVPQPIRRGPSGQLIQDRNQIKVYFNEDALLPASATNAAFYQLIYTNGTAQPDDDTRVMPSFVTYDAANRIATLTFPSDLALSSTGQGIYRLRIGDDAPLAVAPIHIDATSDPASTFDAAMNLNALDGATRIITGAVDPKSFALPYPGSNDEPGHRDIPAESHVGTNNGGSFGTALAFYNFQDVYGTDPQGNVLQNGITEAQKQRAREVFELYGYYLGIKFIETADLGITVVTGDLRALAPSIPTGPGGVGGIAGGSLAIMDASEDWGLSEFGGGWFTTAMHEIGHVLGLGHTYDLPPLTIMGNEGELGVSGVEGVFPGDHDIVHGRHLYPTTSIDVDAYQFTLPEAGLFTAEIVAGRLEVPSLLDSVLTLFNAQGEIVARNDRYFGSDSFLELELGAGTYFITVSSSGGSPVNPRIEDSSLGGTSDGEYQLRLDFKGKPANQLVDSTGKALDGDADGRPGGAFDFWFQVATLANTIFVDKAAPAGGNGGLTTPFRNLGPALAAASPGDVVRIVGNGGADGNLATLADNLAYEIGYDQFSQPLADGTGLAVPQGVTVMIDAGAVFKLRRANIEVGTADQEASRAEGALQILGTTQQRVYITSYADQTIGLDTDPLPTTPLPGDWGGLVFLADSDREADAIFLNVVNYADIRYGGGTVLGDGGENRFTPIYLETARPTVSYTLISRSADAAMSANPNSFEDSRFYGDTYTANYRRIGPDLVGNRITENTINALLVRINTDSGSALETLDVAARFDDTEIVHYLPENLIVRGHAGGPFLDVDTLEWDARVDARLAIDAGMVVKMFGSRIETYMGGTLIAEGDARNRVIFTSLFDDRYGAGGTFDTTGDGAVSTPAPGNWGGIYFGPATQGSLDHVLLTFAGGVTTIEGNFDRFNPIEIHQATVRVANSSLERNQSGLASSDRNGRGTNAQAAIFIRGAQPIIVNNVIRDSFGAAISINVNALNWMEVVDTGRSTGSSQAFTQFIDNNGPLVRLNRVGNTTINGMEVRGGTLTTESIWDDTDIVHVLRSEVVVPNHHTFSGLRLQSSATESLVVKLEGATAGITASGSPLDIDDRIGGTVHVVGNPVRPVVITSLKDDSIGAGLTPDGRPQRNTDNLARTPAPGDWRSIKIDALSNDRNVQIIREFEDPLLVAGSRNNTPLLAQNIGRLAVGEQASDDVLRLGFKVDGFLAPGDADVYAFQGTAGTEVWFDIDRTSHTLDTVVELINANGTVLARSNNSTEEEDNPGLLVGIAQPMFKTPFEFGDLYTTNPRDAGMRLRLPGTAGTQNTYYVRVRAASANLTDLTAGETSGSYELQIRLRQTDEFPGSTVRQADIRYATNGIEVLGKPTNSPLLGESFEAESQALVTSGLSPEQLAAFANDEFEQAQFLGNLLEQNRNTISVGGALSTAADVDWYEFTVDYEGIQAIAGFNNGGKTWATVFDIDYADGVGRADTIISVFDEFGNLVLTGRDSDIADDRPRTGQGADLTDLTRGSAGVLDPYIGSVHLPEGTERTYYVAIHSSAALPTALSATFLYENGQPEANPHQLVRLEPVHGVRRIVEDHIGFTGYGSGNDLFGYVDVLPAQPGPILGIDNALQLEAHVRPFRLSDVGLYVSQGNDVPRLVTIDPYTGALEMNIGGLGNAIDDVRDIVIRPDGQMFGYQSQNTAGNFENSGGQLVHVDPGTGDLYVMGRDSIPDDGDGEDPDDIHTLTSNSVGALTYRKFIGPSSDNQRYVLYYAVDDFSEGTSRLFRADTQDGDATPEDDTLYGAQGNIEALRDFTYTVDIDPEVLGTTILNETDGEAAVTARITRSGPTGFSEFVTLSSSNSAAADWAVGFVEIPAGEAFVDVDINVFDNTSATGVRTVQFTAFGGGASISDSLDIVDDEQAEIGSLSVDVSPGAISGTGDFLLTGTVTRTGPLTNPLTVFLTSHDLREISVPLSVTIAAGQPSATFDVTVTDDTLSNPSYTGAIRARAQGYFSGVDTVFVESSEVPIGFTTGMAYLKLEGLTLIGPDASSVRDGQTFSVSDASQTVIFEFDSDNDIEPGRTAVPFTPGQSSFDILTSIENAIAGSSLNVEISTDLGFGGLTLIGAFGSAQRDSFVTFAGLPLEGQVLYGVSDAGYFFRIDEFTGQATIISQIPGNPRLAGLAVGPQNLDLDGDLIRGDLKNTFFAISENGTLFAIDAATGDLRTDVFEGGVDRMPTTLNNVTGLAFSPLDFNLWHPTARAGADPGHGINPSFDLSRDGLRERMQNVLGESFEYPEAAGGVSFYFGFEDTDGGYLPYLQSTVYGLLPQNTQYGVLLQESQDLLTEFSRAGGPDLASARFDDLHPDLRAETIIGNNYNFPGGAHGSLITSPFSLEGYSGTDKPTLYFNYFLETENGEPGAALDPIKDSARVFASSDGGNTWTMLATNYLKLNEELPEYVSTNAATGNGNARQGVQPLFDATRDAETGLSTNAWRQARVDLNQFAGQSSVVLRFDFATAGSISDPSHPTFPGALPGDDLDRFRSAERARQNNYTGFYIDDIIIGFAERGEMVTRPPVDVVPDTSFVPVPQDPKFGAPTQILVGAYQLEIRRGTEMQTPASDRAPVNFQIDQYDTNDRLSQGFSIEAPVGWAVTEGQLFTVGDGTDELTFELVRSPELILANGNRFFDGDTFTLEDFVFEFDTDGVVSGGNIRVPFARFFDEPNDVATVADEIAESLFTAMQGVDLGLQISLDGNRIGLIKSSNPLGTISFTPITDSVAVVFGMPTLPQPGNVPVVYSTTQTDNQVAGRIAAAINAQAGLSVSASVKTGSSRVELDGALSLSSAVLPNPLDLPTTALDDYVALDDGHLLDYTLIDTFTGSSDGMGYTVYILDMTSQTWRDASDVSPQEWQHYVQVVVPDMLTITDSALLFIGGGSINSPPPTAADPDAVDFAISTNSVVVYLPNVPNQPLTYTGDPNNPRSEDASIAYTYYQFNQDPTDETWPLLLPMVKSAVRAMDAAQDFLSDPGNVPTPVPIEEFVVSGGSKRGWTTWLTAATDSRVRAIVPFVFDALNLDEQMIHHRAYYENQLDLGLELLGTHTFVGGYSRSVQDYTQIGAMTALRTHVGQALLSIVDPFEYRDRLTMPKYIVNGAGDEFFVSDSSQFYFDELEGPKYLRYVPNAGHGLNQDAVDSARAFYRGVLTGDDLPEYSWEVIDDTRIVVDTGSDPRLLEANLWFATNPFARDFRWAGGATPARWFSVDATDEGNGEYSGQIVRPASGATAFMIELVYDSGVPGEPYKFTTEIVVASPSPLRNTEFEVRQFDDLGDENLVRDQGQTIIEANRISDSANAGILVTAGERDADGSLTYPGGVRNLRELNTRQLVPGVTIINNLIARSGQVGIDFSGGAQTIEIPDPNDPEVTLTVPELPYAAVPFGRIVNNTIYGGQSAGVGIRVTGQASPTLLNNIVANVQTGLAIDPSSALTVVGGMVYQSNAVNSATGNLGSFAITLSPTDPLFVNASAGNFYLASGSQAIDSSINSLQDRTAMTTVTAPMGIAPSPIVAPSTDLFGQVRVDDPLAPSPPGLGSNVFKDRGAVDRVDSIGPRATLILPRDNDPDGTDLNPDATQVLLESTTLLSFSILLTDNQQTPAEPFGGSGLAATTITSERVTLRRDGIALVEGVDYFFVYEAETTTIRLFPAVGIWVPGHVYSIELDNSVTTGMSDMAGNPLQPNRFSGETRFTIVSGPLPPTDDYGDAPAPYPTLMADDGARHFVVEGFHLGAGSTADADGQPHATAEADSDDGVEFSTLLVPGSTATVTVEASSAGFINAWFDFAGDGSWDEVGDQILTNVPVVAGLNELMFDIPLSVLPKTTFARFRFSSETNLAPTGGAADGEVEDYQVQIVSTLAYTVLLTDADGEELVRDVDGRYRVLPGHEVHAEVYVTDQRPMASGGGVFSAFADLVRSSSVFTWQAGTLEIGPDFTNSQSGTVTPGVVDEAGGSGSTVAPGGQVPQLLFRVVGEVDAGAALGTQFTIEVDPADDLPDHVSLVHGVSQAVSTSYESHDLIVDIAGWQNLVNNLDVNDDGFITPLDALIVINDLNSLGPRLLPDPIPPEPEFYIDVNGDGLVTPLDALIVINYLNSLSTIPSMAASTGGSTTSSGGATGKSTLATESQSDVGKTSPPAGDDTFSAMDAPSASGLEKPTRSFAVTSQAVAPLASAAVEDDEYLRDDEVQVLVDAAWEDELGAGESTDLDRAVLRVAQAWHEIGASEDADDEWMLDDFLS